VTIADLVALVSQDSGLAQRLLRYANSPLCARGGLRCVSLNGAIQRVGTCGVENVLLSHMVDGMLCRPGSNYDELVRQVWNHMLRSAPLAHRLAPSFGVDPELGYTLAMLHDCGKLALFERISRFSASWGRDLNLPRHFLLWAVKRLHEPMGGLAALQWGLGPNAAWSIAHHHRDPVPELEDRASEVVFLAERVDLSVVRGTPLHAELVWAQGRLSGTPELLETLPERLDEAA
jgi:HD-like signal output (HDOD) protein